MEGVNKKEVIDLSQIDERETEVVPHCYVLEIIQARLDEIFDLVVKELESIGKDQLLPAGAVLSGGGAHMPHITEFAKDKLRLPVSIGQPTNLLGVVDHVDDPSYATIVGLILWAVHDVNHQPAKGPGLLSGAGDGFKGASGKIRGIFERFLP
jgi:cell division protein FtsA